MSNKTILHLDMIYKFPQVDLKYLKIDILLLFLQ